MVEQLGLITQIPVDDVLDFATIIIIMMMIIIIYEPNIFPSSPNLIKTFDNMTTESEPRFLMQGFHYFAVVTCCSH